MNIKKSYYKNTKFKKKIVLIFSRKMENPTKFILMFIRFSILFCFHLLITPVTGSEKYITAFSSN